MSAVVKHQSLPTSGNKPLPAATFKTSLRDWQARWRAQQAAAAGVSGKAPGPAGPA